MNILLDEYGDSYYALADEDLTINVSVSLPESLVDIVDQKRGDISRSRFIRKIIEKEFNFAD